MQFQKGQRFWRGLAVGGLSVLMALPATAAFGQTMTHADPAHDVVKETAMDGSTPAPHNTTTDIVHARFVHTNRRVAATIRLRDYVGGGYGGFIKTPTRTYQAVGDLRGTTGNLTLRRYSDGSRVHCDGLSVTIHPAKNTVGVSVPTTCLNRPRWVQMDVNYSIAPMDGLPFFDDAMRNGHGLPVRPTFSRRLFTG